MNTFMRFVCLVKQIIMIIDFASRYCQWTNDHRRSSTIYYYINMPPNKNPNQELNNIRKERTNWELQLINSSKKKKKGIQSLLYLNFYFFSMSWSPKFVWDYLINIFCRLGDSSLLDEIVFFLFAKKKGGSDTFVIICFFICKR